MSDYSGRHRPPTRAERRALERRSRLPKSFSATYALPTAAAVTLALTAVGATAAESSPFSGEVAEQAAASLSATTLLEDPQLGKDARIEVAAASRDSSGLSERRRAVSDDVVDSQVRAQERADRDKKRKELVAKKKAEQKAEKSAAGWVRPLASGSLTSGFGFRWGRLHAGVDYGASVGTPLRAMGDGTVVGAGPMSGYGVYIDVEYADGTVSRYGHLSSVAASVGQQVAAGDTVAYSGNTGRSTGPHLHLEIRPGGGEPVDPTGWLTERGIL
ncbi:M23 family metallopeptidase [Janibacter cremeus]|uniref:Murein DD-endopeptidase MepM/ murein hydrolase activator NlpD n=1 Tax=Janibacter cremeus TaxID=1285192 RepID=A0A852VPV0_9MICO|nr:M23 family metallopeptidase [Janibacter cremeus]NYF98992.1 murein DD-endopeptidase MepM/ murein hydrolase activator NlpD [Janibacter cremeus]